MSTKLLTREPLIHENCQLTNAQLGAYTEIGIYNFLENVIMNDFSYTGQFCFVQNADIGKFSNIAPMVRIGATAHPIFRPTLHHFTYRKEIFGLDTKDDEAFFAWRTRQRVLMGHDTWIGHGAIVMPNVRIGNGAVVGAGAVVTKDVEPYTIVAGVPAKLLKRRFSEGITIKLEEIQWWNWSYEIIKERVDDFSLPIDDFIDKYYQTTVVR
jgi:phosphonate metabolism protein (transferase hexapeptide repeat family)